MHTLKTSISSAILTQTSIHIHYMHGARDDVHTTLHIIQVPSHLLHAYYTAHRIDVNAYIYYAYLEYIIL
jgi:hypothetical protein